MMRDTEVSVAHAVAAVLDALAYSDVFDWPLTADEIHQLLPMRASAADVRAALSSPTLTGIVGCAAGLHFLWGRSEIVAARRRRERISAQLWPLARRYGRVVASLPFVRMVAVSGSLAVNAADADADIDLFIVTAPGRLWTTRALSIAVVRAAAAMPRGRAVVCPNYLVDVSSLEISERDRFTAHELAQLVPLSGAAVHAELLQRNAWYRDFLPNHVAGGAAPAPGRGAGLAMGRLLEPVIGHTIFDRVEQWEMDRKVARLTEAATGAEVRYDEQVCKGHVEGHRRRILDAYESRLARLVVQQ